MRVALGGKRREFGQSLFGSVRVDALTRCELPDCAYNFHVEQMRSEERIASPRQIAPQGFGQQAVRQPEAKDERDRSIEAKAYRNAYLARVVPEVVKPVAQLYRYWRGV